MRIPALAAAAVLLLSAAAAEARKPPKLADPAYLETIPEDMTPVLPRGLAFGERSFSPNWLRGATPPPSGRVRAQAEYEPNSGIFIRWTTTTSPVNFPALQTSMTVPLTTADPPSYVYIAVSGQTQENSVRNTLSVAGANLDYVRFVQTTTDSPWMRDYGPRFIENNGRLAIVDHQYNRSFRPNDNNFPGVVATGWSLPLFHIGLVHGGGNFHLFDNRESFMTNLVLSTQENPGFTAQQVIDLYAAYQGADLTITNAFPSAYDSTQHIDMWMLPLANNKILIGEYPPGDTVPRAVSEAAVADMTARGYDVVRTPGWRANGAHYTYANSVLVNQVALICRFGGAYTAQDAQALAVYQTALPDHDIVQVDCGGIITWAGAIHCIVMHVPDLIFRDPYEEEL